MQRPASVLTNQIWSSEETSRLTHPGFLDSERDYLAFSCLRLWLRDRPLQICQLN